MCLLSFYCHKLAVNATANFVLMLCSNCCLVFAICKRVNVKAPGFRFIFNKLTRQKLLIKLNLNHISL